MFPNQSGDLGITEWDDIEVSAGPVSDGLTCQELAEDGWEPEQIDSKLDPNAPWNQPIPDEITLQVTNGMNGEVITTLQVNASTNERDGTLETSLACKLPDTM